MAKDTKKKKDGGLLQKLRGPKQPKVDPELQALLDEVQTDPSNMRARLKLADYYLKTEDPLHALDQYLTVAETYAEKGFYPKAIAVYKQALQLKSNMIEVYLKLASLYQKLGLMPEVVEQYQKAAVVYEQQGKEREALDIRRMMLDLDPTNVVGRLKLGQRYLEKGFTTEAVNEFMRVANVFEKQGKTQELQKLLEGILDRGVENFEVLHRLVESYRAQGRPELALARLAKLSGELAGSSSTLELTAELAEQLGKPAVAVKALERAADLYHKSARADKVRELCDHLLRLDASNQYATQRLAELGPPVEKPKPARKPAAKPAAPPPVEAAPPAVEPAPVVEEEVIEEVILDEPLTRPAPRPAKPQEEEIVIEEIPFEEEAPAPAAAAEAPAAAEAEIAIEEPALDVEIGEPALDVEIGEPGLDVEIGETAPAAEEEGAPEQIDLSGMSEDEAAARLDEAIDIYLKYNLRDKAIEYLNLALQHNPDSLPILEKLMIVRRDAGDEAQAAELLDRLVDLAQARGRADKLEEYLSLMVESSPEDMAAARRLADHYAATDPARAVVHLFELATRHRDLNQFADAEQLLLRVLELDPDNQGADQELMDLYEQTGQHDKLVDKLFRVADQNVAEGDLAEAEHLLRRVLELRPMDEEAQDRLLNLYEAAGEADKQLDLLQRLVDRNAGAGELDRAFDYCQRWIELEPASLAAHGRLKDLHLERGATDEAMTELGVIATIAAGAGRHDAAIEAWREALRIEPLSQRAHEGLRDLYANIGDNASALAETMALAKAALDAGRLDEGLTRLNQALELDARHEPARRRKIAVLRELDRTPEAAAMLFGAAADFARTGEVQAAEAALQELLAMEYDPERARHALKDLYLNAGLSGKAAAELLILAKAAEDRGDADAALTCWGEITGLEPDNLDARLGIVRLHRKAGATDQAVAELLSVADLQERRGAAADAISTLEMALADDPQNDVATQRLIDLYFAADRVDDAVKLLLALGDRARDGRRLAQARDAYARVVDARPEHLPAHERLADAYLALGRGWEAVEELFSLAALHQRAGEPTRVEDVYRRILHVDPENQRAAVELKDHYLAVGRVDLGLDMLYDFLRRERQRGDLAKARAYAEEMLAVDESDRRTLLVLAELAEEAGDAADAAERYLQLATLAEEDGRAYEARDRLTKVVELDPANEVARHRLKDLFLANNERDAAIEQLFALADLAARRGEAEDAAACLREVLVLDEANEPALERLVGLMVAAGEGGKATAEMFQLADLAEARAEHALAEKHLRQVLVFEADNARALERLSQVHIAAGDAGQAVRELFQLEEAAEKRYELAPALELLGRILALDPDNLSAMAKRAELEEMLGRNEDAVRSLLSLTEARLARGLRDDGVRALRDAQRLAPADAAVHERLIGLLSELGQPRAVAEELWRFHAGALEAGDPAVVVDVAGRILELDPQSEKALRLLADAYQAQGRTIEAIDELFVLADLAAAGGRPADTEAALKEALSIDAANRQAAERLAALHHGAGRDADALRTWLSFGDALQQAENTVAARDAYERALAIDGGHGDALRKLKESYLSTADLAEAVEVLWRIIAAADARREPEKAIGALEEILELDERNEAALVELKSRYLQAKQPDKAVALLIAADRKMGLVWGNDQHAANLREILAIEPENKKALRQLADLQRDTDDLDGALETLERLGGQLTAEGDPAPAERVWREILSIDPRRLVAHEQLAALHRQRGELDGLDAELFALAKLRRETGDIDGAERMLREIVGGERHREKALEQLIELFGSVGRDDAQLAVRFEVAELAAAQGQIGDAEAVYNEILAVRPDDPRPREALMDLYAAEQRHGEAAAQALILADRARKLGERDAAIAWCERGLSFDPANAKARRRLKNLLVEDGQLDRAVEQLRALADAAFRADSLDGVEDAMVEILELQPENTAVRQELIDLYERTDQQPKAIIQLLELADQLAAVGRSAEALEKLETAGAQQPDNEPLHRRLKEAYLQAGDKAKAIQTLFHLYTIEIAAKKRRSAEIHLREILVLDPANAEAKEKVFALFKAGVTTEEKIADLFARAEEAAEAGDADASAQALKQVLAIDPNNAEAQARLAAMLGAAAVPTAAAATMEEPVADEVFVVQQLDERQAAPEDEVLIDWGAPTEAEAPAVAGEVAEAPQAVEEDVFGAVEETSVDDIDVFGEIERAPAAKPAPAPEPEPPAAEPGAEFAFEPEPPAAAPGFEPEAPTPPPPPASELTPEAEERLIQAALGEALPEAAEVAEELPALDFEEERVAADAARPSREAEPSFLDVTPPTPDERVDLVDGLVSGVTDVFQPEREPGFTAAARTQAAPDALKMREISTDDFVREPETPPGDRIVEEFRPFTDSAPDELLDVAAPPPLEPAPSTGEDLMSDLLLELEGVQAAAAAPAAGARDLLTDIFGPPAAAAPSSGPSGDALSDLLGDLGAEQPAAPAEAGQDIFQSFVASLSDEKRSSSSARTHYELGIAFREMDSIPEAIAEFEKALTKDDGSLTFAINYELGQCYLGLNKFEMAVEYLESALAEGTDDEQTQLDLTFELGVALKKLGRFDAAKRAFVEVDARSSNYRGAKAEIAECERGGGKKGGSDNIGYL